MRPIDADALKEKINITFWSEIGAIIDNAPTIEPKEKVKEILNYLDTELHPIVSPEHWYVYRNLHDMILSLSLSDKPQGKWIDDGDTIICNKCGTAYNRPIFHNGWNYCPNCGADMTIKN